MKKSQINVFNKGISNDIDYMYRENTQWDFPTINYRVLNTEGQGMILSTLPSNKKEFNLTYHYIALGCVEYRGILYIVSKSTDDSMCEIGMFPSFDTSSNSWINEYAPLKNYSGGIFRTSLFNFNINNMCEMIAKESYDTSVDLYICDYLNPNRVVNTGIKRDGSSNGRTYSNVDFQSVLNQIVSTGHFIKSTIGNITTGGELKYGNYYFYFIYSTSDFNKTGIIGQSGVYQVYNGDTYNNTVEGGSETYTSDKKIQINLSNIDQSYTYIYVAYTRYTSDNSNVPIIETGMIDKPFSIISSNMSIIIDGRETIIPYTEAEINTPNIMERTCKSMVQESNRFWGANWKSPDSNSSLLKELAETITVNYDDTTTIIKDGAHEQTLNVIDANIDLSQMQYKNYYITFDKVGYFRGEPYAFTMGFKFKDGSKSNVFPITGYDYVYDKPTQDTYGNETGIVVFPFHNDSNTYTNQGLHVLGIKFDLSTFITEINGLSEEDKLWFYNNISGIFFARAKRKKWLQYQGLSIMGSRGDERPYANSILNLSILESVTPYSSSDDIDYKLLRNSYPHNNLKYNGNFKIWNNPDVDAQWGFSTNDRIDSDQQRGYGIMPLMMHNIPMMSYKLDDVNAKYYAYYGSRSFPDVKKYCIFSPDFMFNSSNDDVSICKDIKVIARTYGLSSIRSSGIDYGCDYLGWLFAPYSNLGVSWNLKPHFPMYYMRKPYSFLDNIWLESDRTTNVSEVKAKDSASYDGFCNIASDYATDSENIFGATYNDNETQINCNRNLYTKKYIGLNMDTEMNEFLSIDSSNRYGFINNAKNIDLAIVNIYNQKIDDDPLSSNSPFSTWYPLTSDLFYQIGEDIIINYDIDSGNFSFDSNDILLYYGDCFLQRTFFKQMTWDSSSFAYKGVALGLLYSDSQDEYITHAPVYSIPDRSLENNQKIYYRHGTIISIVTENSINTAMRFSRDEFDYYPKTSNGAAWSYMPLQLKGIEDMSINAGHSEILSSIVHSFYDSLAPSEINIRPTRVRYSSEHSPYSFKDGYRLFDILGYQDYDLTYGPINKIISYLGNIVTVQEDNINLHIFGRDEITMPTNVGDVVLGNSKYLSPHVQRLGNFGTQHQFSVLCTNNGIYGVDANKRLIWSISTQQSADGKRGMSAYSLSMNKNVNKWLNDTLYDMNKNRSDIMHLISDKPAMLEGIVSGYDPEYNEVLFTFFNKKELYTYVFNNMPWLYNSQTKMYEQVGSGFYYYINAEFPRIGINYIIGLTFLINGEQYVVIDNFKVSTYELNEDLYYYVEGRPDTAEYSIEGFLNTLILGGFLIHVDNIRASIFDINTTYKDEFILICTSPEGTNAFDYILDAYSSCDGCALMYIKEEQSGAYIIQSLNGIISSSSSLGDDIGLESTSESIPPTTYVMGVCVTINDNSTHKTLVYNEVIQAFTGEYSFASHLYPTIGNDLYSFKPFTERSYAYKHNIKDDSLFIYDNQSEAIISIIVNGMSSDGNTTIFEKLFDNVHIHTDRERFSSIIFETENHKGIKDPFHSDGVEFWSDPEWLENKFYLPIQCQTESSEYEFIQDSQMRGTWLKITLKYTGRIKKFIKSIITEFTTSES